MLLRSRLIFLLFLYITFVKSNHDLQKRGVGVQPAPKEQKQETPKVNQVVHIDVKETNIINQNKTHNITESSHVATEPNPKKKFKTNEMESGAVLRGVLVVVSLSILFLIYLALKLYCTRNKKAVVVRKYGVRTRRSDIEMTPLPLDEDEDDETVFDVGNFKN